MLGDNKQAGKWSREDMVTNGNRFIELTHVTMPSWLRL